MRSVTFGVTLLLVAVSAAPALAAKLHPGDRVEVVVYNHPELSGMRTLDASGSVSLPLAGTVPAVGLEPEKLAQLVQSKLAPFVRHAAVEVKVAEQTSSIFVDGGPVGVIKYEPGATLANVVEQLAVQAPPPPDRQNGATARNGVDAAPLDLTDGPENFRSVRLSRDGSVSQPYDLVALRAAGEAGPSLLPGDTISIARKEIAVAVLGDVAKPGTAYIAPTEPLERALAQAGGINPTGSQDGIVLRRGGNVLTISAGAPEFALPAQSGDQLTVRRAPRVDVIGEVQKPGETYLRGDSTLVSALYYAGGPAEFANLKNIILIHDGVRHGYNLANLQHGGDSDNPQVMDGDIVLVPKGSTFRMSDIWLAIGSLGFFGLRL